jgi:RNA-directed DNA polymerase
VSQAPPGKARRPAGPIHPSKRGDARDGGTSGNAKALWRGVRQSSRRIGAMAARSATTHAPENASGPRQRGETCAREAARPGSQETSAVQGTWGSAGAAGRPRRTPAGQAGTTPAGPGAPSPGPSALRVARIATQAQPYPDRACTTRAHPRDVARRERALRRLTPPRAPGVDRGTWQADTAHLATTLGACHAQRVNAPSGPQPVGRRLSPTRHGTRRPLGLPSLEATSGAQAGAMRLAAISAQECCDVSDGFRPGRRPHPALHAGRPGGRQNGLGSVIDGDSSACCDQWPHDTLRPSLGPRSQDGRGRELSARWRTAGLLDGPERGCPEQGSPHGAVRAPRRAHGDVHAGLARWCETVGHAHGRGQGVLDRSADEVVMGGERAEEARRLTEGSPQRCAKDGRESNTEQTTGVRCGRPQRSSAARPPGTVSFRGCGHDGGTTWRGSSPSKRKTEGKRRRRRLGACWRGCRAHRHRSLQAQDGLRCAQRRGSSQDDGVRGHSPCLALVSSAATRAWRSWLHRRGGRQTTWRALGRMRAASPLPRPQIVQGWVECGRSPHERGTSGRGRAGVRTETEDAGCLRVGPLRRMETCGAEEPYEGNLHVRVWGGCDTKSHE